jgi:hypothetical protein
MVSRMCTTVIDIDAGVDGEIAQWASDREMTGTSKVPVI